MVTSPFARAIDILQTHYAFTLDCSYARANETTIDSIVMTEGRTTGDMVETYNMLVPESMSVFYIQQSLILFDSAVSVPRAGDTITVSDGTVYKVHSYEPSQSNIDWRLIAVREEL